MRGGGAEGLLQALSGHAFPVFGEVVAEVLQQVVQHAGGGEQVARLRVGGDRLRHSADELERAVALDEPFVEDGIDGVVEVRRVNHFRKGVLPERAEELRKRHGVEKTRRDAPDAEGRNLFQRELQQGACRHDMQSRHLFPEIAKRREHAGRPLDLVEKEQRLAGNHRPARERGQLRRERLRRERAVEEPARLGRFLEVDFDEMAETASQRPDAVGLSDLPRTAQEKRLRARIIRPGGKNGIKVSLHGISRK